MHTTSSPSSAPDGRVNPSLCVSVPAVCAAIGCGLSPNYWVLIGCRMLVGVGEASFVALAAPFIGETAQQSWHSDDAPQQRNATGTLTSHSNSCGGLGSCMGS